MFNNVNSENKNVCDGPSVEVLVSTKYDKTIKNNMNAKYDTIRKRTSLIIVPHQQNHQDCNDNTHKSAYLNKDDNNAYECASNVTEKIETSCNLQERHNQTLMKCSYENENSVKREDVEQNVELNKAMQPKNTNDGVKRISLRSVNSCVARSHLSNFGNSRSSINTGLSEGDVHNEDYCNLGNENFFDDLYKSDRKNCLSNASSDSSGNSLFENFVYEPLIKSINAGSNTLTPDDPVEANMENERNECSQEPRSLPLMCEVLLSPHQESIGRRYAEVAQFKRSSDPSGQQHSSQNQLKSTSVSVKTGDTTANIKLGLDGAENSGNINNNNDNHRRSRFSGLKSFRGNDSDNNDDGEHDKINLSFDNLMNTRDANSNDAVGSQHFNFLDASDRSSCDDGHFEDDMQVLLSKCLSRDRQSVSRISLASTSDAAMMDGAENYSETTSDTHQSLPCRMGLVERMLLTHPVWFLPGIQRSGAVHFLQGKEEGNFIVRGSSQPNTMAVSVRLPPNTGPYIEHYLIQSNEGILSLESSRFNFDSIPALIAHYAQCCDELPVQLVLPRALREAKNRQQLSSLALLGQELWRYPMYCPKTELETSPMDAKSPISLTDTSGLGTTVLSSLMSPDNGEDTNNIFGASNNVFSQVGTPSDSASSVSSFATSGAEQIHHMSQETVDSIMLTMSPTNPHIHGNGIGDLGFNSELVNKPGDLSTFKSTSSTALSIKTKSKPTIENEIRPQRPKPPNTLNLDLRKPPTPPLRWSKSVSAKGSTDSTNTTGNFTVTTTVVFSVDNNLSQFVQVATPSTNNSINANATTLQTFSKRLSPEGECKDTMSSQGFCSNTNRWPSKSNTESHRSKRNLLSLNLTDVSSTHVNSSSGGKSRKANARNESKHYQESNLLQSPLVYGQSTIIDKISDNGDLWLQEQSDRTNLLTTFKPQSDYVQGKRPDLLAETPTYISKNVNLSRTNSITKSVSSPLVKPITAIPTVEALTNTQHIKQLSSEASPCSKAVVALPALMSQSLSEDHFEGTEVNQGTEREMAPSVHTIASRNKQGSPPYAEPVDALSQLCISSASILRRTQPGPHSSATNRRSEPLKSDLPLNHLCALLAPSAIEKPDGNMTKQKDLHCQKEGSLKKRDRSEQWQIDSSWEFMSKQDSEDIEVDEMWTQELTNQDDDNILLQDNGKKNIHNNITVYQMIAKRLPDLNLPELLRCPKSLQQLHHQTVTTQHQNSIKQHLNELIGGNKTIDNKNRCRLSSYDNVERNFFTASYFNGIDSAQSDDGTVFSEPWDSSQWDSIIPTDDTTASDTIHLSRCRAAISEDDTIVEELSTKEINQDTLKKKSERKKVATILRNASLRDREILSHPRNKVYSCGGGAGDSVRVYTLQLAQDNTSTFSRNIENFITCTKDSREVIPQVVMRNMRQFMNGMKNYLVKHGEGKFHQEVETARLRLKSDEFLNLDAILETVMHQLVVLPLREHLYGMFVDYYTRSKDIQLLAHNIKYASMHCVADFGIRNAVSPPSCASLNAISNLLLRLQETELPLEKLEIFLRVVSTIFDATGCPRGQQLGADDFLPVLVYVVAKCGFVAAEIEAEFMWGLLQPTLLNGEPGYYLTALCSAVHVLKSFTSAEDENGSGSLDWTYSSLPACSSVIRVIIPDECNGSLQTRTLPVRPHTTTREVCRIIAHKARITNPQDYALFQLVDGEETLLSDHDCPQDVRFAAKGKHCMLAYKRIDAKIAWPTAAPSNLT